MPCFYIIIDKLPDVHQGKNRVIPGGFVEKTGIKVEFSSENRGLF